MRVPQTKAVLLFTETTKNITKGEKEAGFCSLLKGNLPCFFPIAFGGAGLSDTA